MADEIDSGTAPGSNAGQLGGGTPTDVPAAKVIRTFTQEEFDTNSAKLRAAVTAETQRKRDSEWLEKLGAASFDEVAAKLKQVQEQKPPEKTEAQIIAEKVAADYEVRLAAERTLRLEAEARDKAKDAKIEQDALRAFVRSRVANTTDPELAVAMFTGMPYAAPRKVGWADGKPVVIEDGVVLAHIDAGKWLDEAVGAPELRFFQKPTSVGSGARTGNGPAPSPAKAPVVAGRRPTHQELLDAAVAAGMASVNGSNGSGR